MPAPYNFDVSNPATTTTLASYPANEQAFRTTCQGIITGAIDATTGLFFIPTLTTTQKNALVNPPTGTLVWDTTLLHLYVNTGTPGTPTWTQA